VPGQVDLASKFTLKSKPETRLNLTILQVRFVEEEVGSKRFWIHIEKLRLRLQFGGIYGWDSREL
jgi:hypothetical protein